MTEENEGPKPADPKLEEDIEFIPETGPEAPSGEGPAPPAPDKKDHHGKEAAAEGSRGLKDKLKRKDADLKQVKKERDELKDQYLRKLAEIENLRKRFEREKSEYYQFALSGLLLELLAVKDNLERALQSQATDMDGKTFREGVELIDRMFHNLLAKNGVQPVEIKDRHFDPAFHQAMTTEESEAVEEPEILEELQKGYLHHGRLLRPSLVKVAVPKKG